jgi:hypothetical protein
MSLVPVLLGSGKPFFGTLTRHQQLLADPKVVEGSRVLHLVYPVRRG